jgi:hypothetical protein
MHLSKYRLNRIRSRARETSEQPLPTTVQAYLDGKPSRPAVTEHVPSGDERRSAERIAVQSAVTVRRIGGFNFEVSLNDISSSGCSVEMLEASEVGDTVIARFPELEPLGSRICWTRGRTTGVEFFNRIHPAVLDLLVSRLPAA